MAVDRKSGEVAGFLNGLATDGDCLKDEFFRNADLHDPTGDNVMILGLAVLPKYRGIGVASELMRRYSGIQRQHLCGKYPFPYVTAEAVTDFNHLLCPGIGFPAVIDLDPFHKEIEIFSGKFLYPHILRHQFRPPDSVLLIVLYLLHGGF